MVVGAVNLAPGAGNSLTTPKQINADSQRLIDFEETPEHDDEILSEEESKEEPYARDLFAGDSAYNQAYDENTSDDVGSFQRNLKSGPYHNSIFS